MSDAALPGFREFLSQHTNPRTGKPYAKFPSRGRWSHDGIRFAYLPENVGKWHDDDAPAPLPEVETPVVTAPVETPGVVVVENKEKPKTSQMTAKPAGNTRVPRIPGQPTKGYTIVYPTAKGRAKGAGAFLWSPQTCSAGHRIGYCPCDIPTAAPFPGEGSLHDDGVIMWDKPASL